MQPLPVGVATLLAAMLTFTATAPAALAADSQGYFYGADGNQPTAKGTQVFYSEPTVGGTFEATLPKLALGPTKLVARRVARLTPQMSLTQTRIRQR